MFSWKDKILNINKKKNDLFFDKNSFCVLKKWVHYRIGQCVRPSVNTITLHNYIRLSWKFVHRIVSSISREREEDENDPSRNDWVIEKIVIVDQTIPEGGYRDFFQKKKFSQNYLKHIWIDSVFNADSEYDISFEPNRSFLTKHCLKKVSKCRKTVSRNQIA